MILKRFVFNNSKSSTIILIHGLYANIGFWLNYLSYFKNYRLVIYNIEYNSLLNPFDEISELAPRLVTHDSDFNADAIISHSLGTIIADLLYGRMKIPLYNICPVAFGKRLDLSGYVDFVSKKLVLPSSQILQTLRKVDNFYFSYKNCLSNKGINLIPKDDLYFTYNFKTENVMMFNGDHFNIKGAFENCIFNEAYYLIN